MQNPSLNGGNDFVGTSHVTVFPSGPGDRIQTVTFSVRDDEIPEHDEAFTLQLLVTNAAAAVGTPSTMVLTISANDNAFGIFSFKTVSYEKVVL